MNNARQKKLLVLSWRDIRSSAHGGAEVYTHEIFRRLTNYGWQVEHLSPYQADRPPQEVIDGICYRRRGNLLTIIAHAYRLMREEDYDLVVDQCNTFRFFTPFWLPKSKRVFLIFQLTREIWHYNLPILLSHLGAIAENWLLKLYRKTTSITISQSTVDDLIQLGYQPEALHIVPNGFDMPAEITIAPEKKEPYTFVYFGRFSPYKGIDHIVQAFAILKRTYPQAKLWLIGKPNEEVINEHVMPVVQAENLKLGHADDQANDIVLWGYTAEEEKKELLSRARALVFPAVREGWGRTITEAALCGTPSVVYDAPGVIDAVDFGRAGFVAKERTVDSLAEQMKIVINDDVLYQERSQKAYDFARTFTWEATVQKMNRVLENQLNNHAATK